MTVQHNFKLGDRVKSSSFDLLVIEQISDDGKKAKVSSCANRVGFDEPRQWWVDLCDLCPVTNTHHQYAIDDKVTHHDLFPNGYFTVVGVRANELELKGDFSGGTCGFDQTDWVPLDKISPYKPEHFVRPPRGLLDRKYVDEKRQQEINEAIKRYLDAGKVVPGEWLDEYNEIVARRAARESRKNNILALDK